MEKDANDLFEEAFPSFGLNFALNGFRWAENLYQKWEDMCENNIIVQEPRKIVDSVGEHVKKIYEEVTDDLLNPFSCASDRRRDPDFSSKEDTNADVHKGSQNSHEDGLKEAKIAALPEIIQNERNDAPELSNLTIEFISAEDNRYNHEIKNDDEGISKASSFSNCVVYLPSLPAIQKNETKGTCDLSHEEIAYVSEANGVISNEMKYDSGEVTNSSTSTDLSCSLQSLPSVQQDERKVILEANKCTYSSAMRENNEGVSSSSTFSDHSGCLLSADGTCLSGFPENAVKRELNTSYFTNPSQEDGNSLSKDAKLGDAVLLVPKQSSSRQLDASSSQVDFGSSYCSRRHETGSECSVAIEKDIKSGEEFEDVSLEDFIWEKILNDCWDEAESYELALISFRSTKNKSYKKKLKDAISSRFHYLKKIGQQDSGFYVDSDADLEKIGIAPSSPVSRGLAEARSSSTLESESDWELL